MLELKRSGDCSGSWNFTTNFERWKLSAKRNRLDSFNSGEILKRICYLSSPSCLPIPLSPPGDERFPRANARRAKMNRGNSTSWIATILSFFLFPTSQCPRRKFGLHDFHVGVGREGKVNFRSATQETILYLQIRTERREKVGQLFSEQTLSLALWTPFRGIKVFI